MEVAAISKNCQEPERAGEWPVRQQESEALEVPPVSMEIMGIVNEIDKRTCLASLAQGRN